MDNIWPNENGRIFQQPRFPWNTGSHFPYFSLPFGGPGAGEVAIIWSDNLKTSTINPSWSCHDCFRSPWTPACCSSGLIPAEFTEESWKASKVCTSRAPQIWNPKLAKKINNYKKTPDNRCRTSKIMAVPSNCLFLRSFRFEPFNRKVATFNLRVAQVPAELEKNSSTNDSNRRINNLFLTKDWPTVVLPMVFFFGTVFCWTNSAKKGVLISSASNAAAVWCGLKEGM